MSEEIKNEIKKAMKSGKIFSVVFIKKDGTARTMSARMGVKKHLTTGAQSTTAHIPKYLTVYDLQKQNYRNVNTDTIISFKCGAVKK